MAWELAGNPNTNPPSDFLGTVDTQPLVIKTNGTEVMRVNAAGTPSSALEVAAQDGLSVTGFQPFITLRDTNTGNARSIIQGVNGDIVLIPDSFAGSGAALVAKTGSGNVGIGTSTPSSRLEIIGQDGLSVTGFQPFITLRDTNTGNARSIIQGVNGDIVLIPDSFAGSGAALVIRTGSGDVTMNGNLTVAEGKDIMLSGGDCAEDFEAEDPELVEPGTVMVVDSPAHLAASSCAYDTRVAGVVSGAGHLRPAIRLNHGGDAGSNRVPIALLGRVMCKVEADSEPVAIGDLLTTSDIPGHAMKAEDRNRAFGAILGKAMAPAVKGRDLIPVLVTLQ